MQFSMSKNQAYKIARAQLGAWKMLKTVQKWAKMTKIAQKRQTTLNNEFKTKEISTPVKKIAWTASTASAAFSISGHEVSQY